MPSRSHLWLLLARADQSPAVATIGLKPLQGLKPIASMKTFGFYGRDDRAETLTGIETRSTNPTRSPRRATIGLKPLQGLKPGIVLEQVANAGATIGLKPLQGLKQP